MEITSGVAQGSILAPDHWNASYDSLLRLDMLEESRLIGYTDDVTPLVSKPAVNYLGLMINSKISFFEQIKTEVASLSRLMANVGGPISTRKDLFTEATQSVLLYGAEIWADALDKEVHRKRLAQVQRRGALRVASAYHITSEPAVMVIAGMIPVVLLAKERKAIYRRKGENLREVVAREERQCTLTEWQNEPRGRWTAI